MLATFLSDAPSLTEAEIKKYQQQIGDLKSEYQSIPSLNKHNIFERKNWAKLSNSEVGQEGEAFHPKDILNKTWE